MSIGGDTTSAPERHTPRIYLHRHLVESHGRHENSVSAQQKQYRDDYVSHTIYVCVCYCHACTRK